MMAEKKQKIRVTRHFLITASLHQNKNTKLSSTCKSQDKHSGFILVLHSAMRSEGGVVASTSY